MNEIESLKHRFRVGVEEYYRESGERPSTCIMCYEDYLACHAMARMECTVVDYRLAPNRPPEWMGVQIFYSPKHNHNMLFGGKGDS